MRVVDLQEDVLDADAVGTGRTTTGRRACRTRSCGATPPTVRGRCRATRRSTRWYSRDVVEAVEQARPPSRSRSRRARSSGPGSAPGPGRTASRPQRIIAERPKNSAPSRRAGAVGRRRRASRPTTRVQAHDGARLLARGEQRVPVRRADRRQAELIGVLGEADGLESARARCATIIVGGELGVEQPRDLARDDAVGVRARPVLEVPVVPRPRGREREARDRWWCSGAARRRSR